jgi:hypothetical protein
VYDGVSTNFKVCADSSCPYSPPLPRTAYDKCDPMLQALEEGDQEDKRGDVYCEYKVGQGGEGAGAVGAPASWDHGPPPPAEQSTMLCAGASRATANRTAAFCLPLRPRSTRPAPPQPQPPPHPSPRRITAPSPPCPRGPAPITCPPFRRPAPRPQNWRTGPSPVISQLTGHTGRCTNSDPTKCHGNCDIQTG